MLTYSSLTNLWSDKSIFKMFAVNFSTKYLTEFSQRSVPFKPSSFNPEQLSEICWIDSKFSCLAQDSCKICKLSLQKALPDYDRAQYVESRFKKMKILYPWHEWFLSPCLWQNIPVLEFSREGYKIRKGIA